MQIKFSLTLPEPPAPPKPDEIRKPYKPTMEERIQYALDCIDCKAPNRHEAIQFLQRVYAKWDVRKDKLSKQEQILKELIAPVVHEYGYYPENAKE